MQAVFRLTLLEFYGNESQRRGKVENGTNAQDPEDPNMSEFRNYY